MRGRMGLHVSGLDYEHREIILRNKPPHMLEVSPKGTVPVFIKADGHVIDESIDLLKFGLSQNDPMGWLNCDLETANELISDNDGPFKHHLDRYKYASRYKDDAQRGDVDLEHRKAAEAFIQTYENILSKSPFLLGKSPSIADIAIFPFMRQFANTDKDWWENAPYSATRHWLDGLINSDIFKAIMVKHELWNFES